MIDRLVPSDTLPIAHAEKPRPQHGRGFAEWLERDERTRHEAIGNAPGDASLAAPEPAAAFPEIQVQLRSEAGALEMISLPWKLAANGSLSQWSLQRAPADSVGRDPNAGAAGTAMRKQISGVENTRFLAVPEDSSRRSARGALAPQQVNAAANTESVDALSPTTSRANAAMPWLLRLFRWLEQKGHDPTIWLRDYRLDQADSHQLAEALRLHASEQGIRLERIVVNGRELWRAPTFTPMESADAR